MINLSTAKQLNILLPNTNKALNEVLKDVSPEDLETLSSGKDIKSVINSLLSGASKSEKSDKLLLELLKNNPTLKKIGTVSNTINDLLKSLKSDKESLPIEKDLKEFLVNIKDLDEKVLKKQVSNSGVFFESKLKDAKNPQVELKNLLSDLSKSLKDSKEPIAKETLSKIDELLSKKPLNTANSNDILTKQNPNPKELQNVAKDVKTIISDISELDLKKIDTKEILKDLKTTISSLQEKLQDPKSLNLKEFTKLADTLTQMIKSPTTSKSQVLQLTQQLTNELENIDQKQTDTTKAQQTQMQTDVKESIKNLKTTLSKFQTSSHIDTISKKLSSFTDANKLHPNNDTKEIVENDLKSTLLKASEDISSSNHPNKNEILKNIDKLTMQIDYNQLVSNLTNSTSLYMPFTWNEMQEGSIKINEKEDRFYCDIELKLKEHGDIRVRLALYDKNQLSIYLHSEDSEFRADLKSKSSELKIALNDLGLNVRELRVFEEDTKKTTQTKAYKNAYESDVDMGFNLKI